MESHRTMRPMSVLWAPGIITVLCLAVGGLAEAGEREELEKLSARVFELYQQGQYADAIPLATRVLERREKLLGTEHTHVATSLNNLAALYQATGDYARAAPFSIFPGGA